jgi:hypothetical protein
MVIQLLEELGRFQVVADLRELCGGSVIIIKK